MSIESASANTMVQAEAEQDLACLQILDSAAFSERCYTDDRALLHSAVILPDFVTKRAPPEYLYVPVEKAHYSPELGEYRSTGICAYTYKNSGWAEICSIPDISTSWEFAAKLAQMCTRSQLDPIHLMDVVQDSL